MARQWTNASVLDALRAWHDTGKPLSELRRSDPGLIAVAQRRFGSWYAARMASGLPPLRREWTPQTVIAAIQDRHARGLPLTQVGRDDSGLEEAARRRFGSWTDAVRAAGLQTKRRRSWNRRRVLEAIQDRQAQGLPMTRVWEHDEGLYLAAVRHLGSWHTAMAAAGFTSTPRLRWSPQLVIDALRAWHRSPHRNPRACDHGLGCAAVRYFGSLQAALQAAGLESRRRKWSEQRVLEAIQDGHVKGLPARRPGFGSVPLAAAAQRRFGSWRKALSAAGLDIPQRQTTRWTRELVIAEIRRWHDRGLSLTRVWEEYATLAAAAGRHFGGWHQAIAAAGLEAPMQVRKWTRDRVVEAIRERHQPGTSVSDIWRADKALCGAAVRCFGSWRSALMAAGLQPARKRWTKQLVIQGIRARHNRGLALTGIVFKQDGALARAAVRHFGSWREALLAAGIEPVADRRMSSAEDRNRKTP